MKRLTVPDDFELNTDRRARDRSLSKTSVIKETNKDSEY